MWFDFVEVEQLAWPFRLRYLYLISRKTLNDEINDPPELKSDLLGLGIKPVDLNERDWRELVVCSEKYGKRLSRYDLAALAIAKTREIPLLTGDGALRKAAKKRGRRRLGNA